MLDKVIIQFNKVFRLTNDIVSAAFGVVWPTTTPSAPSSLCPRPRTKAALLQRQSCHLRAACVKHHRRRAVALPSPQQLSRSRCRHTAAAKKLLSPLPPPWRFRRHHKAVSAKLPPPPRRHQAATTKYHRHRRRAVAPPPLPSPSRCRCRQAAAAIATTTPSWHRSAFAAATPAKLPPLPPCCRHCRCAAATTAKQPSPPLPSCRRGRTSANQAPPLRRRCAAATLQPLPLPNCCHRHHAAAHPATAAAATLRMLPSCHRQAAATTAPPPSCHSRAVAANGAKLPSPPPCCRHRHRAAANLPPLLPPPTKIGSPIKLKPKTLVFRRITRYYSYAWAVD
jgi:hypothetical protein